MSRFAAYLKKDGWILAALLICVLLCLALGAVGNTDDSEEDRLSRVLSTIEGAGQVEVAVHYAEDQPVSAVIVAQGAGEIDVQLRLISAVTTLLGIDQRRVAIYEREKH